jgi:hypothetical protein
MKQKGRLLIAVVLKLEIEMKNKKECHCELALWRPRKKI